MSLENMRIIGQSAAVSRGPVRARFAFRFSLLLSLCCLAVEPGVAAEYGTYELPFATNSIWNLPIPTGANRQSARFNEYAAFSASVEAINKLSAGAPLVKVYKKKHWKHVACDPNNVDKSSLVAEVRLPSNFLWTDAGTDGGRSAI